MTQPTRILLIEDLALIKKMISGQLDDAAFPAVLEAVGDLQSGLQNLARSEFDVVLLDLGLPDSDGLVTFDTLHDAHPGVPIVVLTANSDRATAVEAIRRGAQDFIVKDELSARMLARVIQYAIERKQRDIEKDRLNETLREKTEALEALIERQKRFLGMASHDLRNPLTLISCYLDLYASGELGVLTPQQKKAVSVMRRSSDQMLAMLNDLLDINAIESGKLDLKTRQTDLGKFLEDCRSANVIIAASKSIEIVLNLEPGLPQVEIDVDRMSQVFNNLLSNAIKFSHSGSSVTMSARREGASVRIDVTDTGVGIPEQEIGKLFTPFARLSVKPTAGEKSTGLGLSIVRKLVLSHGGTVSVTSTLGKGSTFSVTIPIVQCECSLPRS